MNRVIRARDLDALYVTGPGHGGPGLVANAYLEGTYSEIYPSVGEDVDGMRALFRQFSFPGGIPSHVAPETPGSIHEGGELGYALLHACGAVFDNPDLVALCVVGDGEAETGPLAASWHSNKFLDPRRDGTVLPVLHLNGYKIANPTVLARIPHDELDGLLRGYGYAPAVRRTATNPPRCTRNSPRRSTRCLTTSPRSAPTRAAGRPHLADDRAAHPEGVDGPEGGGRQAGGGQLPRPPGAAVGKPAPMRATAPSSRSGCAATALRSCSTRPGGWCPSCARSPRTVRGG